jgi:endonuclease-3
MNRELIVNYLDELFEDPKCELIYNKDYELLLSVMLSAQTTDKSVNKAVIPLYKKYDSLDKLNDLSVSEIESYIKSIGLSKTKSNNFKKIVSEIYKIGYVPNDRKYLESLPGVGRKTASVVLAQLFNEPGFAVDTHVHRVSKRLKIAKEKDDVLKTEVKLKKFFKKEEWNRVNSELVLFGRYYCTSKNPKCDNCKLKDICKKEIK